MWVSNWADNALKEVLSEMNTSHAVRDKINEKLRVNTGTGAGSLANRPLNIPGNVTSNVTPLYNPNSGHLNLFDSSIPRTVTVPSGNLNLNYTVPQTGLGEGYVRNPTTMVRNPNYVKTINSADPLEWNPSSLRNAYADKPNKFTGAGTALRTLTGLVALDEAINGNPTALGMLLPNAAGIGLGSLLYSTPLNEGEDEKMQFINLPWKGSVLAATNGTDIGVANPDVAKEYADSIASSLNFESPVQQQTAPLKPSLDPNDLLNEAIKYRKLNNIIKKGAIVGPQEDSQITVQGAPEVVPETDTMEVVNLDETPIKKSAGEITKAPVESNTKTYDANGNLVSGSDPKVNTSNNTQRTLGTKPQPKGYITDGDRTTVIGDTKVPAKTSTSSVANPPADATTVHATPKTASTSSASVKQGNFTRRRNRTSLLSTPELTKAILNGEFGNGKERIANLTAQGYSPEQIKAAQDQINSTVRPVRRNRAPVQQRRVAPTLSEAVMYNRPDTVPAQVPVTRPNTNPSGYTKGHEAVFNPRTGRLEFI